jgi:hypothetical protein
MSLFGVGMFRLSEILKDLSAFGLFHFLVLFGDSLWFIFFVLFGLHE